MSTVLTAPRELRLGLRRVEVSSLDTRAVDLARARIRTAVFHGAWMVILLMAGWKRFALPLSPLAEGDLGGFLHPALSFLAGRGFQPSGSQPFLYPGLLTGLLSIFQDFRAITILSRLLGLGGGLLLLASWRVAGTLLPERKVSPWLYDAAGLAMFSIVLFAPASIQLEYAIRSDSICPFFAALSIFCSVRFLRARAEADSGNRAWIAWGAATLFAGFLLPTLKPSFWMSGMISTIPVWVVFFGAREKWSRRCLTVAPALAAVFFFLLLPARHFARMDATNSSFFPQSIFSIHALIIRDQIAADAQSGDAGPYSREDLESTLALLDAGIQASRIANPRGFPSLGYDADQLLHHGVFFTEMERQHGTEWTLGFYRHYFWRTWWKQPRAMAAKVGTQLRLFYNLNCPVYRGRRVRLVNLYGDSIIALSDPQEREYLSKWPPAAGLLQQQAEAANAARDLRTPKALNWAMNTAAATYLPLFLIFLVATPWVLADRNRRARYGGLIAILAVGYGFNVGNNLGLAIFHTLEVNRYMSVQFATTAFSQMLCAIFLGAIAVEIISRSFPARAESRRFGFFLGGVGTGTVGMNKVGG